VEKSTVTLVLGEESAQLTHAVAIDLSRSDIEEAMGASFGEPVELILDVEGREIEAGDDAEPTRRSVSLAWDPADLERLLATSDGDRVPLVIDGEALHAAFVDPDVEAHGLREKLIVVAAVAAVAAGGANAATASPLMSGAQRAGTTPTTIARDMPADSQQASLSGAGASVARDMPADSQAASLAGTQSASQVARDMPADSQAASLAGASSGIARDMPADSQRASLAASATSATSGGSDSRLSLPDGGQIVLIGGFALAIVGAGFAASRTRPRPRPA
jgi:hypothetical protein